MKRRIIIPAIVGIAFIGVPAAASATMAYISIPKVIRASSAARFDGFRLSADRTIGRAT